MEMKNTVSVLIDVGWHIEEIIGRGKSKVISTKN